LLMMRNAVDVSFANNSIKQKLYREITK